MSEDLSLAYLWTTREQVDWDAARAVVLELTAEEIEEEAGLEGDEDEDGLTTVRGMVSDELEKVRDMWEGEPRRDCERLTVRGLRMLITGGMSSGDPPTDALETIFTVPERVLKAAGFFDEPAVENWSPEEPMKN